MVVVVGVSGGTGDHSEADGGCLEGRVAFLDPGNQQDFCRMGRKTQDLDS